MTQPILISSQDAPINRSESPETILDSEEERQEFYLAQREKRKRRKIQKRTSQSGGGSGSCSGPGAAGKAVSMEEEDSVRFLGAKLGRRMERVEVDEEIEVIGVVPSAPVLRAPTSVSSAAESAREKDIVNGNTSTDDGAPSGLRANLAKFRYTRPAREAPIPTSRAAVAAIKARATLAASETAVAGPSSAISKKSVIRSKFFATMGKLALPEMPVAPEQLRELDACVVCAVAFDRRKTAKTRWQHMVNCFPSGHQPHDPLPDLPSLITHALDKLTRNTFQPALATQTTLLQSVALDHARPLPRDKTSASNLPAGPVEMHLDPSRSGRARLNARKRALAGRRDEMDVRIRGVDAESRGGVGLSEEIRGMLDEEFAEEYEGAPQRHRAVEESSASDEDVPLPATQAFGESSLQARMQSRSTSRGLFEAESAPIPPSEQPFRSGEEDRVVGSSFRSADIKTTPTDETEQGRDDRGLKRRKYGTGTTDGTCGIESVRDERFGLGRDQVCARVEGEWSTDRHSGQPRVDYNVGVDPGQMQVDEEAEKSFFEDKLPFASSPPPPPSTPIRREPASITPLKRTMDADEPLDADSPALSRLAKRMARSSMSSPQVPHIADVPMAHGPRRDGLSDADDAWEDEQDRWGEDAMLEWNASGASSQDARVETFGSALEASFPPPSSPLSTCIDGSPDVATRAEAETAPPKSRMVAPPGTPRADAPISPEIAAAEDRIQTLLDRGMPDYASWDLPDLQTAVKVYGIKSSKIAATMVKQLQQCWEATHPEKPATKAKSKAKAAAMRKKKTTTTQSESSEEESLAHQAAAGKKKRATKKIDKPAALTLDQLNAEFQKIMLEPDNYIKVLRYEPFYFEDLVAAGTGRGLIDRGWKNALKKYLDEQSITYFVEGIGTRRGKRR